MTGAYVRVQRAGEWQPIEVDQLTDDELATFFDPRDDCAKWAKFLASWIRDNVHEGLGAPTDDTVPDAT